MKKMSIFFFIFISLSLLLFSCEQQINKSVRKIDKQEEGLRIVGERIGVRHSMEQELGTSAMPIPFRQTITMKEMVVDKGSHQYEASLELSLQEVIRGKKAWTSIQNDNQFNPPPEEGFEYVLVKVKGLLKDAFKQDHCLQFSSLNFHFISDLGEQYDIQPIVISNRLNKRLCKGGIGEGFIYAQVKENEPFLVVYESVEKNWIHFLVQ